MERIPLTSQKSGQVPSCACTLSITILAFDKSLWRLLETQIMMMILENMLTNIYRNSAYTDEMHSLIMQAAAVVAVEYFRV